jgi:hypothetical protein
MPKMMYFFFDDSSAHSSVHSPPGSIKRMGTDEVRMVQRGEETFLVRQPKR